MIIRKPKKRTRLTKNFSFKGCHMDFFKECVPGQSGSYFIQKLVENSEEFKEFMEEKEILDLEGYDFGDI